MDNNVLIDALKQAEILTDGILDQGEETAKRLLNSKEVLAIGTGLVAAGTVRYLMMHPEIIEKALEQIGASLEIGGQTAQSGFGSLESLLPLLGTLAAGGAAAATAIPGVPPPP